MPTLIRGSGTISSPARGFQPGHAVLIEDERIVAVGPAEELLERADHVVEWTGLILIPGFVDAHTHISIRPGEGDQHAQLAEHTAWQAIRGVRNVAAMIASGVTTARIMGERDGLDFAFKRASRAGEISSPRLFVSGMALSASHGHGRVLGVADGVEGVRQAVRANLAAGADHIKLFVTGGISSRGTDVYAHHYSREEIRAAVEEAHRAGVRVAAHAHGGPGVTICAEEGVDSVEHGALLTDENVAAMREHGTRLVLTNAIAFHPEGIAQGDADSTDILAKLRAANQRSEGAFERARDAGIPFALGTDSMHGYFGHEIVWLTDRGVSPADALTAATQGGALVMGLDAEIGELRAGMRADIIALGANPLEDPRAVFDVREIMSGGVHLERSERRSA